MPSPSLFKQHLFSLKSILNPKPFNHPFSDLMSLFLQSSQHVFLTSSTALTVIGFITGTIYISLTPARLQAPGHRGPCLFNLYVPNGVFLRRGNKCSIELNYFILLVIL